METQRAVAILGAGMAGATVARRLADAGQPVRVFDKGRIVGGRMAVRRVDAMQFDHGAQFMRAHGSAFASRLAEWERDGIVAPWAGSERWVGVPDMTAPVRALLAGIPVASATTITRVVRREARWHLADTSGAIHGPFDAVAITFPAPQVAALLDASGLTLSGLAGPTYAPCWSVVIAAELDIAEHLIEPRRDPIGLISSDSSKPGRSEGSRLTVHATPAWSRRHLEEPREAIVSALIQATAVELDAAIRPTYAAAHRWRYAQVETALGRPCLYDRTLRLGAAGDWCIGPRIEAAHDSGSALAAAILAERDAAA